MKNKILFLLLIIFSACESYRVLLTSELIVNGDVENEFQSIIAGFHPNVDMESMMRGSSKNCVGFVEDSAPVFLCKNESKILVLSTYKDFPSGEEKYNINSFRGYNKNRHEQNTLVLHDKIVDALILKFKIEKADHLEDKSKLGEKLENFSSSSKN